METASALRANRGSLRQAQGRLFDCASRDETATGSAQDDNFYFLRSLKFKLYQAICRYELEAETGLEVDDSTSEGTGGLAEVVRLDIAHDAGGDEVEVVEEIKGVGTDLQSGVLT